MKSIELTLEEQGFEQQVHKYTRLSSSSKLSSYNTTQSGVG